MEITHEYLFDRIRENPLDHLGGYLPELLHTYFFGYELAREFHRRPKVRGQLGLSDFNEWFRDNAYGGREGFAAYCGLITDSDVDTLNLFFEFRKTRLRQLEDEAPAAASKTSSFAAGSEDSEVMSVMELTLDEAIRKRPAMYFGNRHWIRGMWAMWSGFIWAERDIGIDNSRDSLAFREFQDWMDKRHPYAHGKNWGKVIEFLGMDVNANALEQFYDHFELFLDGAEPDVQTKRIREWIAACIADVEERKAKGEL